MTNKSTLLSSTIFFSLLLAGGCATVPSMSPLAIDSTPSGALVTSSEGWSCKTPCTLEAERGTSIQLSWSLDGHATEQQSIQMPEFKPSRVAMLIGSGIGAVSMIVGADFADAFARAFLSAIFGEIVEVDAISSGEKLRGAASGALVLGALGFGVDRLIDQRSVEAAATGSR